MKSNLFTKIFLRKFAITISTFLFISCSVNNEEAFTIIGKWGMVSGTISNPDGTTNRYDKLSSGNFYQTIEYQKDGTLIKITFPDYIKSYGIYTFNNVTNELSYKLDGDIYYCPAIVQIIDNDEMIITTNYGTNIGKITQYFIKTN